jgi:hypothetical protein
MPLRQSWIDPNTGASFPATVVFPRVDGVQAAEHLVGLLYVRFAGLDTYSAGYKPVQVVGTQITGVAYGSWFQPVVGGAQASFQSAIQGAAASFVAAAPEFSGAVFF